MAHSEHFGQFFIAMESGGPQAAKFRYLFIGELGLAVLFPFCGSAFVVPIRVISGTCANKKVIWVATRRIIAGVADQQWMRVYSVADEVGHAISPKRPITGVVNPDIKRPVTPKGLSCRPTPAVTMRALAGSLIHFRPETGDVLRRERWKWFTRYRHVGHLHDRCAERAGAETLACTLPL
jgi:hypothetical protein